MNGESSRAKARSQKQQKPVKKPPDVQDTTDQKYIYTCQYCRVKFAQNSHYHRHLSSNHTALKKEATYQCDECRLVFSKKTSLDAHCRTHKIKTGSRCSTCSLIFKSRYCLRRHVHLKQLMLENTCPKCNKIYPSKETLAKHLRKHRIEIASYKCDQCVVQFKIKNSLSCHMNRIHIKQT